MVSCVITIAREHGSGGRKIGQALSGALGIPFYDKALISMIARESGFSEEFVGNEEAWRSDSFLYDSFISSGRLPLGDQLFIAQSKAIREVAQNPCVIVGRCADYVLRKQKNCLNVFIHAPIEERVRRVRDEYKESEGSEEASIRKLDKRRATYYARNTQRTWGQAQNFHICLNSEIGLDACVAILKLAAEKFDGGKG